MNVPISFLVVILSLLFSGMCTHADSITMQKGADVSVERILDQKLKSPTTGVLSGKKSAGNDLYADMPQSEPNDSADKQNENDNKKIDINFDAVDLTTVINKFAGILGVNVVLPTGADAIKSKVTLQMAERLSVSDTWNLLYSIVDIAGYSLIKRREGYVVKKNNKELPRQPFPIYIGVSPGTLPDTDKRIRFLYYLSNIQVPGAPNEKTELNEILVRLLPPDVIRQYMPTSNGILLVGKANDIKAVMKIVLELDKAGFRESFDVIRLRHSSANIVAELFNKNILSATQPRTNRYRRGARQKTAASYFTPNMKIIPVGRTNSLVILGRQQAIERVREFIYKYVDVKLDSGKSILHVHQLQYLDAASFKKTLETIVKNASTKGTGQSRAAGTATGPERFFEGVLIMTDMPAQGEKSKVSFGGNQLIIAARNEDWIRIKKLIEELDRPQPQVIIEILIADLIISDERALGSHTRTPAALNLPPLFGGEGMEFQASPDAPAVAGTSDGVHVTDGLHTDLLNKDGYLEADGTTKVPPLPTVAQGGSLDSGSTVVSLNDADGNTWSILQVLQKYENTKILSHPHVVATNNKQAIVKIGESRLIAAEAAVAQGTAVAKLQEKKAELTVTITPRISGGDTVNLQVQVDINEWVGETANRIDRKLVTNANVKTGSILALGGLIKIDTTHALNETPILGKIPILGWLFKKRAGTVQKNNLTVFIRPTIVQPRLRGGIDKYTRDYINVARDYVQEGMMFDTLREPITRWFFKTGVDAQEALRVFASDSPQRRPAYDESDSVVKNDDVPMPVLMKDPNKTVLAALEGPAYRSKSSAFVKTTADRPAALEMKRELMDFAPQAEKEIKKETVAAKQEEPKQKPPTPISDPTIATAIEAKEAEVSEELTPEEQLKRMIAGQENPLLRS